MMDQGWNAVRDGGGAIASSRKLLKTHDSKHYSSKEKHGEKEKKMASSPKRRRTPIHPQAPTMINSYP
jgi:hypothetical protein